MLRSFPPVRWSDWLGEHWPVLAVTAIGLALRIRFLSQTMRGDETFSYLVFTLGRIGNLFYYPVPNNHVLNTVLMRLSTTIFGDGPEVIRLPAFLFGVAAIPLVYLVCRRLCSRESGFMAVSLTAVHPFLVLYSTNARGYSAVVFFSLLMVLAGLRLVEKPRFKECAILSLFASLGLFAVPVMVFPLAGIYAWVFLLMYDKSQDPVGTLKAFALPCGILTVVLTTLLYLPVLIVNGGAQCLFENKYVKPQPLDVFMDGLFPHLRATTEEYALAIPFPVLVCLGVLFVLGLAWFFLRKHWKVISLALCLIVMSLIILEIEHSIPYTRIWIFFLPISFLFVDQGFVLLVKWCGPRIRTVLTTVVLAALLVYAGHVSASPHIADYSDPAILPEADCVAGFLQSLGEKEIRVRSRADHYVVMAYYLHRRGVPLTADPEVPGYFVASKDLVPIYRLTRGRVMRIFECGNAEVWVTLP